MEKKSASPAKIARPIIKDVFPRKRAFEILEQVSDQPVIWISGPAGCGKTTLVSSFTEHRKFPTMWYRMDKGDSDEATFAHFMNMAVNQVSGAKSEGSGIHSKDDTSALRCFENICDRMPHPGLIVFDDYQKLPAESSFHKSFCNALSRIPEGIRVIIISRNSPPRPFMRMIANRKMEIAGWDSLRLTPNEAEGVIRRHLPENTTDETVHQLHSVTGGWVAGLMLMIFKIRNEGVEMKTLERHVPEEISDYFECEVFDALDQIYCDFLLKTAFLPEINGALVSELTHIPDADRILFTLARNNCFVEKVIPSEAEYRYHPLFRAFLQHRAMKLFSDNTLSRLRCQAATLFEQGGDAESAFSLLYHSRNWERLGGLIQKRAPSMVARNQNHRLKEWINMIPDHGIQSSPWLIYWKGISLFSTSPCLSRNFFETSFGEFKKQSDPAGLLLSWSGAVDAIETGFENFSLLDRWISEYDDLSDIFDSFPSEDIEARVTSSVLSAMVFRQPHHPRIEEWADRAFQVATRKDPPCSALRMMTHILLYRIYLGDFEGARGVRNTLRQGLNAGNVPQSVRVTAEYTEELYLQLAGIQEKDGGTAVKNQVKGERKNISGHPDSRHFFAELSEPTNLWLLSCYHFLKTRNALNRGDFRAASFHMAPAVKAALELESPFILCLCNLANAHILHELEKHQQGRLYLESASEIAHRLKSNLLIFYVIWTEALFAADHGEDRPGLAFLKNAIDIRRKKGFLYACIDNPSATARLCVKALDNGFEVEYIRKFIQKRDLIPDNPPIHLKNWPWKLKIFTLGRFALVKNGKPVLISKKAQQKPLSMLKAVIAFGGREVREDQIADALWPDADGDIAHKSFATTLHRLRRLIGYHDAVRLQSGCLTLNPSYCWVDSWQFERVFGQADSRWKKGADAENFPEAIALTQRAIDIYQGGFLSEDQYEIWTTSRRERLRSKFLRGIIKLGQHWEKEEKWENAIECYQRGLEVDAFAEELYRRLMFSYYRIGHRAEALNVYERCKQLLAATLDIEPSPQTLAIGRKLYLAEFS
ncbi:hypothetical protein DENIS_2075 [Desulfonema ishimotonii]|uniref:Bacterial transcriptional activator domain-containing protein n=2 Tax=Desulfonema ishimotonii TaxID=45657 RepID=A0A401FVX6_9BACT|nr:hypothetical protein DENIS_2075 [Desulfonema ishimotonii]